MSAEDFRILNEEVISCRRCPRLVRWRTSAAKKKPRRFAAWDYWAKPIPGFGDPGARLLLVGLAPAAHGGNRTGRMFTGDRSGDWLFRALCKAGYANQSSSDHLNDGLRLKDCYITATCRCAPPQNRLLPSEIKNCRPFLHRELLLLNRIRVIIGLGRIGFETAFRSFRELNRTDLKSLPLFKHGAKVRLNDDVVLLGSFHPSQQNTFTGKLTEPMFDAVFRTATRILKRDPL